MDTKDTLQKISKKDGKKLAYCLRHGYSGLPTLVFLSGYRSDMNGSKALFLEKFCTEHHYGLLRFDYSGHGQSDGIFDDLVLSDWLDDTLTIITSLVQDDVILIGSSMGGWIGLLVAQHLGKRIKGFIGIASAPDFTDWIWNNHMTASEQRICKVQGYVDTPDGGRLTLALFEDGMKHLVFDKPLFMPYPVILLQGIKDNEVPYAVAQRLGAHITPNPATLILIGDGDHRLARPQDLELLAQNIHNLMNSLRKETSC